MSLHYLNFIFPQEYYTQKSSGDKVTRSYPFNSVTTCYDCYLRHKQHTALSGNRRFSVVKCSSLTLSKPFCFILSWRFFPFFSALTPSSLLASETSFDGWVRAIASSPVHPETVKRMGDISGVEFKWRLVKPYKRPAISLSSNESVKVAFYRPLPNRARHPPIKNASTFKGVVL